MADNDIGLIICPLSERLSGEFFAFDSCFDLAEFFLFVPAGWGEFECVVEAGGGGAECAVCGACSGFGGVGVGGGFFGDVFDDEGDAFLCAFGSFGADVVEVAFGWHEEGCVEVWVFGGCEVFGVLLLGFLRWFCRLLRRLWVCGSCYASSVVMVALVKVGLMVPVGSVVQVRGFGWFVRVGCV